MDEEEEIDSAGEVGELKFNVFWPVLLMGVSLILVLTWEILVGATTRRGAQQLEDQQVRSVEQSKRVQQNLEKLVRGLVELAKTDEAAQKLVTKCGIKVTNPAGATPTASP